MELKKLSSEAEEILKKIRQYDAELPVIMVSGQEDIATAVKLLRQGAYDYLVKNEFKCIGRNQ